MMGRTRSGLARCAAGLAMSAAWGLTPPARAQTTAPAPASPSPASSIEERLRKLEETNRLLLEQNRMLTERMEALTRPAAPATGATGGGTATNSDRPAATTGAGADGTTGTASDGRPPRSDASTEGGAGARDNPAEPSNRERNTGPITKIPVKGGFGPGLVFETDDGEYQIQFHNQTQIESRIYQQGGMRPTAGGFYVPRQRLIFQGRLTKSFEYEGSVEAAYGTINLLNAFLTYHPSDKFLLKFGRYKVPFGYEYYAISNTDLLQPERSLFGTNFGFNRMPGIMAYGQLLEKRLDYAVGIFDGPRNQIIDFNNDKDIIAYLNARPFQENDDLAFLKFLNIGGSVDAGSQNNLIVPQALRTSISQSTNVLLQTAAPAWFAFNNNVTEAGWRSLWSLHAAYYYKGLSLYGEWQSGFTDYSRNREGTHTQVPINGYYLSGGYFLTGETAERRTQVRPLRPFNLRPDKFGLGAVELQARYSQLTLGENVFTAGLADPNLWSNRAYTVDLGVNWYLSQYIKLYLDWQHAEFGEPVQFAPGRRQLTSDLFWLRAQVYF